MQKAKIMNVRANNRWGKSRWSVGEEVEMGEWEWNAKRVWEGSCLMARFPDIAVSHFRAAMSPRGDPSPRRTRSCAWRDIRRTVIYVTVKKYDNRRCQGRFGLIGDRLSTLVTRCAERRWRRLSFTLHYPKLESLSLYEDCSPARFHLIAVARANVGLCSLPHDTN